MPLLCSRLFIKGKIYFHCSSLWPVNTNIEASPLKLSLPAGLTDLIRTQQTVIAAVGDEVLLNCQLLQHEDVVQVIWWKILIKGMKNLISYHKKYGQDVNPALKDKIGFTDAGLQNSSIFIRNVTEEDEGCYLCLFNIHPGDDLEATTCLQVYGKVKSFLLYITKNTECSEL